MKEIMASAADFNQMGAKDNDEILKALELERIYKEDENMSDKQAHQLAGISAKMISEEGYKASDFANSKKREEIENRTADIVKEYAGNLNEKQQSQLTKQIMSGNEYMAEVKKRQKNKMNYRDGKKNNGNVNNNSNINNNSIINCNFIFYNICDNKYGKFKNNKRHNNWKYRCVKYDKRRSKKSIR